MILRTLSAALILAATTAPTVTQKVFPTPDAAAQELVAAAEKFDVEALKQILGPDGVDLVVTEDQVMSKNQAAEFAAIAREKTQVVVDPKNPKTATLVLGKEDWPAPIPIIRKKTGWVFDTKTGRKEILYRRVGRNELDAIQVCRGFVEAQDEYALTRPNGGTIAEYAQKIISTPGKKDGLAWQNPDGTWGGPIGESVARVIAEGYSDKSQPYHGYYFKVLKGQGPAAPLGTMDYVIKGAMIGGFALAAAPSDYAVTGVKSFIVSQDGVVYERDFGDDTADWFKSAVVFNPDQLTADETELFHDLTHEFTHAAMGPVTTGYTPSWLVEGFAEYVPFKTEKVPSSYLHRVLEGLNVDDLPKDDKFYDEPRNYVTAWLACRLIAERYGEAKLLALYEAFDRSDSQGSVLPRVLGISLDGFTAQWRAYVAKARTSTLS